MCPPITVDRLREAGNRRGPRLQLRDADEGEGGLQELQQLRRRQHVDARQQRAPRRAQDRLVRVRPASTIESATGDYSGFKGSSVLLSLHMTWPPLSHASLLDVEAPRHTTATSCGALQRSVHLWLHIRFRELPRRVKPAIQAFTLVVMCNLAWSGRAGPSSAAAACSARCAGPLCAGSPAAPAAAPGRSGSARSARTPAPPRQPGTPAAATISVCRHMEGGFPTGNTA